jgi:hypothetical protein
MQEGAAYFVEGQVGARAYVARVLKQVEEAVASGDLEHIENLRKLLPQWEAILNDELQRVGKIIMGSRGEFKVPELLPEHKQGLADALLNGRYDNSAEELPEFKRILTLLGEPGGTYE